MSRYLVDRIRNHPRIEVRTRSHIAAAAGDGRLETLTIVDAERGEQIEAHVDALFVLIGAEPVTAGVEGWLRRDRTASS